MGARRMRFWAWVCSILMLGLVSSMLGSPVAQAAPGDPFTPGVPVITGTARVGATLSATPGTWAPEPESLAYQWLRDATEIGGAVTSSYVLTADDLGKPIRVRVTASGGDLAATSATSAPTAKVAAGSFASAVPVISGTVAVGSTIQADTSAWAPEATLAYQWYASGKAISRATGKAYKLTTAQHGKQVSVRVTGRRTGYATVVRTSAQTGKVMIAGTPKIVGTLSVGSTLTVSRGSWTSKVSVSYQWLRDGAAIPGATKSSYRPGSADAGKQVSVRLTGKRSGYASVARFSALTARIVSAATPKISGSAVVGSTLTATPGTWSAGTVLSYQWLRSGKGIAGATTATYRLAGADDGKQLTVRVTGRQAGWATVARTSAKTAKVMKAGTPVISGTARVGSTLKAKPGSWSSKVKLSYQWLRGGIAIKGATKSSYKTTSADAGRQVSVKVTGKRSGYTTATRTSAPVTIRLLALSATTPKITGQVRVGGVLTAVPGTWTGGTTLTYA
ncbi:MAG: hypothetical protein REI45_15260, partial [Propionicimonas sp.]|nr:hypothetical protein [Propionicimonas sp.]